MSPAQTIALAVITPDTARQVAKAFADAINAKANAEQSFMASCTAAAKLIGVPITAPQFDKQLRPMFREQFKAKAKSSRKAESTFSSELSRLKTFCLAVCSTKAELQPLAGETVHAFLKRVAEPVALATLPDGQRIWPADVAKPGRAAGTKVRKAGGVDKASSAGTVADDEGGFDVSRPMAAALILAKGNASRAQRLVICLQSYAEEFDRWAATVLTDADKAELNKLAPPKADEAPKVATPVALAKGRKAKGLANLGALVAA